MKNESPHHRSLRSRVPQKNVLILLGEKSVARKQISGEHFFAGLCRECRQVAGLQCGLGFAKTIFWGKGFGKTSAEFSRAEEGSGEESARVFRNRGGNYLTYLIPV